MISRILFRVVYCFSGFDFVFLSVMEFSSREIRVRGVVVLCSVWVYFLGLRVRIFFVLSSFPWWGIGHMNPLIIFSELFAVVSRSRFCSSLFCSGCAYC